MCIRMGICAWKGPEERSIFKGNLCVFRLCRGLSSSVFPSQKRHTCLQIHILCQGYNLYSFFFDALAAQVTPGADAIRIVPGLDPDGLHRLASRLSEATTGLCAALTPNEKGTGYCLAQAGGDVRALTKALNAALNGRGGGKPGICQGSCAAAPEQVEAFLREQE